jgi:sarcosine oxidase subunit beta
MKRRTTCDVVVIGAGVQGLSAAYNIALNGTKSVTVVETHDLAGRGSSSRSGSMLMKSRENIPKIALSLYSYARFMNFAAEFGERLTFRRTGFLSAVPPSQASRYEREHALRLSMGVTSERLTPDEMRKLAPGLYTEDLAFGIFGPEDGEILPAQILSAYERAGRALGVTYAFGERATDIVTVGGRVVAVRTTLRDIPCAWIVNAGGADAKEVGGWVGVTLPIENRRRSLYTAFSRHPEFQNGPMVEDAQIEWYYRPLGENRVLIGMGREADGGPTDGPNLAFLPTVRIAAAHRAPTLADFEVLDGTSGMRPLTPDILPIVGPVDGLSGLINSCGWGGEGIMHSPAGGSLVADWINDTTTCSVDRSLFLLSRFDKLQPDEGENTHDRTTLV